MAWLKSNGSAASQVQMTGQHGVSRGAEVQPGPLHIHGPQNQGGLT
jgi:hypothetical protein